MPTPGQSMDVAPVWLVMDAWRKTSALAAGVGKILPIDFDHYCGPGRLSRNPDYQFLGRTIAGGPTPSGTAQGVSPPRNGSARMVKMAKSWMRWAADSGTPQRNAGGSPFEVG